MAIISLKGEILLHDEKLNVDIHYSALNHLVKIDENSVIIYKIEIKNL